jgi:hypothetical protein
MTTPLTFAHLNAKDAHRIKVLHQEKQEQWQNHLKDVKLIPEFLTSKICHKSGKFLGHYDDVTLATYIANIGFERTVVVLSKMAIHYVSPDWLYTDAQGLEDLSVADPVGYYIYCLTKTQWTPEQKRSPQPQDVAELNVIRFEIENKIRSGELTLEQVIATNDVSRLRLSVAPGSKDLETIDRVDLENLSDPETIYSAVMSSFDQWVAKQRRKDNLPKKKKNHNPWNSNLTTAAIGSIRSKVKGYGGFANQKRASQAKETWSAEMYLIATEVDGILGDLDIEELKYRFKKQSDTERKIKENKQQAMSNVATKSGKPIINPKISFGKIKVRSTGKQ